MNRDDLSSSDTNAFADPTNSDPHDDRDTYPDASRSVSEARPDARRDAPIRTPNRRLRILGLALGLLVVLLVVGFFSGRHYIRKIMRENLPQLDGSLIVYGLAAPVTVERDARGVPHIHAGSLDDLVFAQGYVTAQDRLWEMELLRRHAAGELAAVLGRSMLDHDRLQRTLQLRAAADRAVAALPADQKHWLEVYAHGVNASIIAQHAHLPLEFRLLGYQPAAWSPRDSLLVELVMFQDLTTGFPEKLGRESLAAHLSPEMIADLYPVGSWRDHPPGQAALDVTAPQPEFEDIPLDESQSKLRLPAAKPLATTTSEANLSALRQTLSLFHTRCDTCVSGSNAWAISGSRTASGKPLLANDMHLSLGVPGLWYEADLDAGSPAPMADFHVAGVTLPGTPFVIAGHNQHVAWGFVNLGADVQDLYIEHTRGTPSGAEYQASDGAWLPVLYHAELIRVRGGSDVTLNVPLTRHGDTDTPIVSSIFPGERRTLSLRWTIYDPANVTDPFFAVDSASDWTSMLSAITAWGGPPQNLMYADDQGHIGYHAVGRIPLRGDANNPSPLSPVPTDATAADRALHEWAGYIPFDLLPQAFDPAGGILATANSRVTPDGYRFPITLNWMAPYRTERIYKVLEPGRHLTPADMLALQTDVFSEVDQVIAQRLAYSIDHTTGPLKNDKNLHQAADLLRNWNGSVDANAAAPAIVDASRAVLWPMLLIPRLAPQLAPRIAKGEDISKDKQLSADTARDANLWQLYVWGERSSVEEQFVMHTPARWLPPGFATWEDFLAAVVERGLRDAHAPRDLSTWQQGNAYPLDIEHPIFSRSPLVERVIGVPTGTGPRMQSGDMTTIKQVGHAFGPSERFTADLSDPDRTTLNIVLGQSGSPASPWYMDQFEDWLRGATYALPFTPAAAHAAATHTLTLRPR